MCRGEGNPYPDDDAHHQKGEGTINNMDITTQNLDTTAAVALYNLSALFTSLPIYSRKELIKNICIRI